MKLIAHRGNRWGQEKELENTSDYLEDAINQGFDVEIDLWVRGEECFLGHDAEGEEIDFDWLMDYSEYLWIHCKNLEALYALSYAVDDLNYFWHEQDDYTLTSQGMIWTYPYKPVTNKSVVVCKSLLECRQHALIGEGLVRKFMKSMQPYGICSDYFGLVE